MRERAPADFGRLLTPRAIAVVGASADRERIGGQPVTILQQTGYRGAIYPVNPKYAELHGLRCYPELVSVPEDCDVALIAVNAAAVPAMIRDCGRARIPFAVVLSAGFRESGEQGARLEAELKKAAREAGVRVVGPNCIGMMNLPDRVYCGFGAGFANPDLTTGPVAFVSQSGGFAFSVVGLADFEGIGFNYIVSVGNETDVTTLDLIADFLERDEVEVVVAYIEGIQDGRRLRELGHRAAEIGKPILVWKVGNSATARAAAESHTASMTAPYRLYRTAFEEGGYVEIEDVHDLVDAVRAFLGRRLPRGSNVAVLTTSGGAGVLIADACDRQGLTLPPLAPETVKAIAALTPAYAALANPVDVTAQVTSDPERVNRICAQLLADPHIDQLIVRYGSAQGPKGEAWARGPAAVARDTAKPLLVAWSRVPDRTEPALKILESHRIPWLLTPARAAKAAGALQRFAHQRERYLARAARGVERPIARQEIALPAASGPLSESASRACLASYGIPVTRAVSFTMEALARLEQSPLPYPVAVKVDSPDIAHKTEAGAVRLNVQSLPALKEAAADVLAAARSRHPGARLNGVLVSEMASGVETIAGAINDRYFGPVVMFGLGGIFAELLQDVAYRFAPFDMAAAHEMIREIKTHRILTGCRGRPALALDALADALVRLSLLAADHADRIAEIDVNPLFIGPASVVAADALVVLSG